MLAELSERGQARASQHCSPEGRSIGEDRWPTSRPARSGTICAQPESRLVLSQGQLWAIAEKHGGVSMGFPSTVMPF